MSVWRNSWVPNEAIDLNQFARIGTIFFGEVKLIFSSEKDATIRKKIRVLGFDNTNSARFSCRQRDLPQGNWNADNSSRYRKQGRTVRRQPHDHRSDNSRRNGGDGTAGYRDLCNLEASLCAFVEVHPHPVGYYFGGVWLRLPVIRKLGYGFHNRNCGPAGSPEDESGSSCDDDCSGRNPYPSFRASD